MLAHEFNHNLSNNKSFKQYTSNEDGDNDDEYFFNNKNNIGPSSRSESCGPTMRSSSLQRTYKYN